MTTAKTKPFKKPGKIETWKYFYCTSWGYIIEDNANKPIGAGVGMHPWAFHPDAVFICGCGGCGKPVYAEMPEGTLPPKRTRCPECRGE